MLNLEPGPNGRSAGTVSWAGHVQQLLLARPGAPRRRRDPDADPAVRRSRRCCGSGRVRARRLRAGRGALIHGAAASAAPWPAQSRRRRAGRPHARGRADRARPGRDRRRLPSVSPARISPRSTPARCSAPAKAPRSFPNGSGLPIEFRDDLIELDFGEWTGTTFDAIRADPRWRPMEPAPQPVADPRRRDDARGAVPRRRGDSGNRRAPSATRLPSLSATAT